MNPYRYKIFSDKKLIVFYYQGNIGLKDLDNCINEVTLEIDYNPNFNVLNDIRDCIITIRTDQIVEIIANAKKNDKFYGKRNSVFFTDLPNQVVFTETIKYLKNENFVNILTISTIEKALIHLGISNEEKNDIENILLELKTNN